ncbi:hypothetical protein Tco_1061202 [Tanacetum coccineum]
MSEIRSSGFVAPGPVVPVKLMTDGSPIMAPTIRDIKSKLNKKALDALCTKYHIPACVHPSLPRPDKNILQSPDGNIGVYTRFFDFANYLIPLSQFLVDVLDHFHTHLSQLSVFREAKVSHFEILCRIHGFQPSVNCFRTFYTSSYTKGWMTFIKRSDAAPVCHSKPLDFVKNLNDHFFWVNSTAFPLSVSLKIKILSKDPPPKLSQYDTEACDFLHTHTAPFRKFPKHFLCWVGISRYYMLDENCYPTFWDGEEGGYILSFVMFADMDLFAFIRHSDPTKVRIEERDLAEREVKLLKMTEGRTILLDPPVTAASGDSSDGIDRLFDDGNDVGLEDASGKSLAALCGMIIEGSGIPSGTRPPHVRYVVSSDGSHHSGSYSEATSFVRSLVVARLGAGGGLEMCPKDSEEYGELYIHCAREIRDVPTKLIYLGKETGGRRSIRLSVDNSLLSIVPVILDRSSLESAFELFSARIEAMQDEQARVLGNRVAELDAQLLEMAAHLDEEFYPRFLTAISGRRWILTHGLKLIILKCLQSPEYCHALGTAIGFVVNKGIQDGLRAGVDNGKARRDLSLIEAYDPSLEAKYVEAMNALGTGPLSEIPGAEDLQPSPEQLRLLIHRPEDNVVLGETSLSFSLQVVHSQVQRIKGEIMEKRLSLTDVMAPLAEPLSSQSLIGEASTSAIPSTVEPVTTLSTTLASSGFVPPLSISDYQVLDAEPHHGNPPTVNLEEEELDTTRSALSAAYLAWERSELASLFHMACFVAPVDKVSWLETCVGNPGIIVNFQGFIILYHVNFRSSQGWHADLYWDHRFRPICQREWCFSVAGLDHSTVCP